MLGDAQAALGGESAVRTWGSSQQPCQGAILGAAPWPQSDLQVGGQPWPAGWLQPCEAPWVSTIPILDPPELCGIMNMDCFNLLSSKGICLGAVDNTVSPSPLDHSSGT